jgi:tRNA dimethylallyltransferase
MLTPMTRHILIIFGPTGVGKSDFAERIAGSIPAEIINMDMGQLYVPLAIGTAKPDWRSSSTAHHLFDIIDAPIDYSVALYRDHAIKTMQTIWNKGKLPILVGGSGFYLKSLLFPPSVPLVVSNNTVVTQKNVEAYWHELNTIDPVRAGSINKGDIYRIGRALDIWYATGVKPSSFEVSYQPPASFTLLFLTRSREELYARINERVDCMIENGWLVEVKELYQAGWDSFLLKKKLIGYNELLNYLQGQKTPVNWDHTVRTIKQRTRQYAKRQHTFWRMLKQQLDYEIAQNKDVQMISSAESINLTLLNVDLYIKLLSQRLTVLM